MHYRPEVDGLRAIAVVPVILFHAGLGVFSGGFVGVDVFFVISGFLITTILLEDRAQGRFSIARFYERRARRILPALFVVCAVTLPFAWAWMLPDDLADYGTSLGAVMLFLSNFHFMDQAGGYFGPELEAQPLLHTWSLAVEEQYYLLLPLVLLAFRRTRPLAAVLALLALSSLALAHWGAGARPEKNFFFTLSRLWELLAGSLAALWLRERGPFLRPVLNQGLSALGLAMILAPMVLIDGTAPWPSAQTLWPVAGTVLVLLCAGPQTLAGRLLAWQPFVAIGLVSYSAYLWHQPLFAFARQRMIDAPPPAVMAALAALSLALAALTWALVEQPFRRAGGGPLPRRAGVFAASLAGIAVFLGAGLALDKGQGMPSRMADNPAFAAVTDLATLNQPLMAECHLDGTDDSFPGLSRPACNSQGDAPLDAVILGDSHASALRLALFRAAGNLNLGTIAYGACPPVPGLRPGRDSTCPALIEQAYAAVEASDVPTVILIARWSLYSTGHGFDNGAGGRESKHLPYWNDAHPGPREEGVLLAYAAAVQRLQAAGKRVIVVYPVPEAGWHVGNRLIRMVGIGAATLADAAFGADPAVVAARHAPVTATFDALPDLIRVRPEAVFCDTLLPGLCAHVAAGAILYDDDDHLSLTGATLLAPAIIAAITTR